MVGLRQCAAIAAVVGAMGLSGCWGDSARSAEAPKSQGGAAHKSRGDGPSEGVEKGRTPHKEAAGARGFVSTYRNREEGISFVYPRNYVLEEGEVEEHSFFLKRQEELDGEGEGAKLVATVLIPEDSYPNTTFEHGSVQLVSRQEGTAEECRESVAVDGEPASSKTISGIEFVGAEQEDVIGGTRMLERVYAGYAKGRCYEFVATVAVEDGVDAAGIKRAADSGKIMKQLEKIITSVEISEESATEAPVEKTAGRL